MAAPLRDPATSPGSTRSSACGCAINSHRRHEFTLSGDVGGFGVGSEFSWQAIGAYRFDFAKTSHVTWSGMIGYRALYVDYERGTGVTRYEFDVLQHGPVVGISARF